MDIYESDTVEGKGLYASDIIPISDKFALGFVEPSLYNVLIETGYYNNEFVAKYAQTIEVSPFINKIYFIDAANSKLVPVDYKIYDNNISKSSRSKIVRYNQIMETFNADQRSYVSAHINAINTKDENDVTYQIPETTCPTCGKVNPAIKNQTASSLVFLRNRLGVLATI